MEPRLERRSSPQDFQATSAQVLKHLHATVGLDLWAVGRRQGSDWVVLTSEGGDLDGLQLRWEDTLCARAQDGRATWVTTDVDQVPTMAEARDLIGLPIRSFVTVPLHGGDGEVLGTLCGAGTAGPAGEDLGGCHDELEVLAEVLGALLSAELRLEREARHREVAEQDAQTDQLTGLGNRRRWDRQLAAEEERCRRYGSSAAVITADLDGLKTINDRWGHDAGDTLLRQLAAVLRRECRPGDVVARLGGDEFAVLLAEAGEDQAAAVGERLRAALAAASVSASLGVAVRGREGLAGAWRDADARMYEEKLGLTRREPVRPGAAEATPDLRHGPLLQELLALARQHTAADIAFLGRVEGDQRVLRAIQSAEPVPARVGDSEDLQSTYCGLILRGELPSALPDTSLSAVATALPITQALPIGGYLGVPVTLTDGRLYGTLCCVSHAPNPAFDDGAVRLLTTIAGSLSRVLAEEEAERVGRRTVLAAIDELLARQALTMLYQPVVHLPTGTVCGVEALARFDDHSRSTTQWFADAATVDRTAELELHTAGLALEETADWPGDLWLNLSASVLVSPAVSALLGGRDLHRVVVEISEHEEVADYATLRRALAPWRGNGLRLAVDDAGAGFSSLRHVLELTPDVIKLDISLVQGLPADPARRALVSGLVAFAEEASALVVAEGIETDAELEALRGTGVTLGQGYHLGRPLLAASLPTEAVPSDLPRRRGVEHPAAH